MIHVDSPDHDHDAVCRLPAVAAVPLANFHRLIGFRVVVWQPGRAVVVLPIRDDLLNRAGTVHGGVIGTLVDAAGGLAGNFTAGPEAPRPSTSLTLVTNFIGSARSGTLRAVGTRRGGGRRIFFVDVAIFSGQDTLIATGGGSYRISGAEDG